MASDDPEVENAVLYFIIRDFEKGISAAAINRELAGLAFLFKWQGRRDHTKDFWLRQAVKGYRKEYKQRDGRRPVSFEMLKQLMLSLEMVCRSIYERVLFKAAFALAFFGALRVSELVSPSKAIPGGLMHGEVKLLEDRVRIWISRSKTDQAGRGRYLEFGKIAEFSICSVRIVQSFKEVRPALTGPFLIHEDDECLSRYQFVTVFKKCVVIVGCDPLQFSSHSFRIGAATEAARAGLSQEVIRRIGRWDSDRFKLYVRPHMVQL